LHGPSVDDGTNAGDRAQESPSEFAMLASIRDTVVMVGG
jgi:hypothetical protein